MREHPEMTCQARSRRFLPPLGMKLWESIFMGQAGSVAYYVQTELQRRWNAVVAMGIATKQQSNMGIAR